MRIKSINAMRIERLETLLKQQRKSNGEMYALYKREQVRKVEIERHRNQLLSAIQVIFKAFPNNTLVEKYNPLLKEK